MDPMQVLPPELVLRICSFLHIDDLVQLWELNHCWRQIVSEPSLWRSAELDLTREWNIANSLRVLRRAPCLGSIFFTGGEPPDKLIKALLETKAWVTRLENVSVADDVWVNQFLQHLGPHLKELVIWHPDKELLSTVNTLPSLLKLEIGNGGDGFRGLNCTLEVPHGFTGHLKSFIDTGLYPLPENALLSILRSHSQTLEIICITVGSSPCDNQFEWPESCDLLSLLEKCNFKALRNLVLNRFAQYHDRESCNEQLPALRLLLPDVNVFCKTCHESTMPHYDWYLLF